MNDSINLLIRDNKPKPADSTGLKLLRKLAIGSFAVTLLCSIVLLLLIVFSPLPSLTEEKNALISQLSTSSEKITSLFTLNERMTNINSVVSKRPPFDTIMESLKAQIPGDGQVQAVKMEGKAVTFGVSSASLQSIDTFISNLTTLNSGSTRLFRTMSLTSLTYTAQRNVYVLTVDVTLL